MTKVIVELGRFIFLLFLLGFIWQVVRVLKDELKTSRVDSFRNFLKVIKTKENTGPILNDSYPINQEISIGRSLACDITVHDDFASQRHCRIYSQNGQFFLQDLGSTNGTYLNGETIKRVVPLRNGDEIAISDDIVFRFVTEDNQ